MTLLEQGTNELFSTRVIIESGYDILLVKRADIGEFKGVWEVPGGKLDPGETIFSAAYRETQQETGLDVEFLNSDPQFIEERDIPDGKHKGKRYMAYGFVATSLLREVKLSNEHVSSIWLPPEHAIKVNNLSKTSYRTIKKLGALLNGGSKII